MRITFVYGAYESLGIQYLSSALKTSGHLVQLIYAPRLFDDQLFHHPKIARRLNRYRIYPQLILDTKPDMVGFSVFTDSLLWCLSMARGIKKLDPDILTIFGGIHPTALPEQTLIHKEVDFVMVGESELSLCDLAAAFDKEKKTGDMGCHNDKEHFDNEKGSDKKTCFNSKKNLNFQRIFDNIPNLYYRDNNGIIRGNKPRPLIKDLDTLPFPDHELFWLHAPYFRDAYPIMTSRGCLFNCTFCNNNVYRKLYPDMGLRRRSPENVLAELEKAVHSGAKTIIFEDDMFISDLDWSRHFLGEYAKRIKKPYQCIGHPSFINDEAAQLLKNSNCKNIEIGVQSLNPPTRRLFGRYESLDSVDRGIRALKKARVSFNIDHIGGAPGEGAIHQKEAAIQYNKYRPNRITFFFLTYYPGTDLAKMALKDENLRKIAALCSNGQASSFEQTGSVKKPEIFEKYRTLMGIMPIVPSFIISFILKYDLVKYLPKSTILSKALPSAISVLLNKEVRGANILKKYLYHLIRMPLGCKH